MKNLLLLVMSLYVSLIFAQTDTSKNSVLLKEIPVFFNHAKTFEPITFVNIDKVTIGKYNFGQDIPQLLERSVSMTATSDAGNGVGYTYMRMRGVDQTRINVTIN